MTNKTLIIVGGANGVGKTTFAVPYTRAKGYDFLNADEIAKEEAVRGATAPMIAAGRIFFSVYMLNSRPMKASSSRPPFPVPTSTR